MQYDRTVLGYHGCDEAVAERLLAGDPFTPSRNDYDWLGHGVYFWEYGPDRALRFAQDQRRRGLVKTPALVGAVIQLGHCFDLLDTAFTEDLAGAYTTWEAHLRAYNLPLPVNAGPAPAYKLRRRDCGLLNWYLERLDTAGFRSDRVRGGFVEGGPLFEGAGIQRETPIQISVRTPRCMVGVFRPTIQPRNR